jgi:Ala-tRNA(Pro) deacylase
MDVAAAKEGLIMAMASTLQTYLSERGVQYDLISHPRTADSMHTAAAAHVPGDRLAKSVVLKDDQGYLIVILSSTHRINLGLLHEALNRSLGLATEAEVDALFADCEAGAVPAVGDAYGVDTVVDESLTACPEVYFESGDHVVLVHLSSGSFRKLTDKLLHGRFARHV